MDTSTDQGMSDRISGTSSELAKLDNSVDMRSQFKYGEDGSIKECSIDICFAAALLACDVLDAEAFFTSRCGGCC